MKWVFRKELYEKNPEKQSNTMGWAEKIDGQEAQFIDGKQKGNCYTFIVYRDWCEQIEEGKQMKMHEILGVKPGEVFYFQTEKYRYMVSEYGHLLYDKQGVGWADVMSIDRLTEIINHPELIIRKPRLTPEVIEVLKIFRALGCRYVTKDDDGRIEAWEIKPISVAGAWVEGKGDTIESCFVNLCGAKAMLIDSLLDYGKPLDIEAALGGA
jgi:hypothetical protein